MSLSIQERINSLMAIASAIIPSKKSLYGIHNLMAFRNDKSEVIIWI